MDQALDLPVTYRPPSPEAQALGDVARQTLLAALADKPVLRFDLADDEYHLGPLGLRLALEHGCSAPYGGLANRDLELGYHRDVTMPRPATVLMVVFRHAATGGVLMLPELGVGLACDDGWVVGFDGAGVLHGVTPLETEPDGYRISLVYYVPRGDDGWITGKPIPGLIE